MAKLDINKPRQRLPTIDDNANPTCCFVCGMRAIGLGIGEMRRSNDDPCYICKRCAMAVDDYKKIRRLDDYELKALDGGVEAVGEYIEEHGVTDLAFYDGLMQKMLVKAAWEGCAKRLRELLQNGEAPF